MVSFPQVSPPEPCTPLSPAPYAPHAPHISFFSIDDGNPVPKYVGVGTYHELCFIICVYCILLSSFLGKHTEYQSSDCAYPFLGGFLP